MRIIVIIPARGGSKSLRNKNVLPLNGVPLLCYSVAYSLKSKIVTSTVVSTDSPKIAAIAKECGAMVPFLRPERIARDNSRDYPFMRHALDYFESKGQFFDIYVLLRPTSPMRPPDLIEKAIKILKDNTNATSVRSCALIKEHPYRAWKQNENGSITGFFDDIVEPYNIPRQQLPALYFQTGDIEVIRRETLIKGSVSGEHVFPLIIKHDEMIDIDSYSDFIKAENYKC